MIFLKFDEDCDDLLNIVEFNQLMAATGGQQLDKIQWRALCKKVEANPLAGLSPEQLGRLEGGGRKATAARARGGTEAAAAGDAPARRQRSVPGKREGARDHDPGPRRGARGDAVDAEERG